jgi:hypothetical protein
MTEIKKIVFVISGARSPREGGEDDKTSLSQEHSLGLERIVHTTAAPPPVCSLSRGNLPSTLASPGRGVPLCERQKFCPSITFAGSFGVRQSC